jgi:Uncharacterized conserved protein
VPEPNWSVVIPVKRLARAKSRLRGALPGVAHESLVLALVLDTVDAVLACAPVTEVLVVTDDPELARALGRQGARIVPEPPAGGLNAAFAYGAAQATNGWVAALTADLPALRPAELAEALRTASVTDGGAAPAGGAGSSGEAGAVGVRRFVTDAPGTGTVLLTSAPHTALDPRFGPDSAAAHAASGARPLTGAWPTLRRDVDTPADLRAATALGLGPRTAALVGPPGPAAGAPESTSGPTCRMAAADV